MFETVAMWRLVVALLPAVVAPALGAGYCSTNTFSTNTSWLQFTKEPIPLEYAFERNFKSIHCCGKGYRSIEWFKNGIAYPWSANVSNFILYPEAANQTLYTRDAGRHDTGNYTCRMSNETRTQQHTVHLEVIDKSTDTPKIMFMATDQWVEEGSEVRLYCEALLCRSYLADAKNDLLWRKVWANDTEGELLSSQREIKTTREGNADVLGSYLMMPTVTAEDYGTYVCAIHSNDIVYRRHVTVHYKAGVAAREGGAGGASWRAAALCAACACALLASAAALHRRFTPRLLLAARIGLARATPSARRTRSLEKDFDVAVLYTSIDAELVNGALVRTLALKYNHRVLPILMPDDWYSGLSVEVQRCRSVVCVVSPAQYAPAQLLRALRLLHALPLPPVVVLLQDLPKLKREAKDERGETLLSVLRRTRLIPWRHVHEPAFWTALRLALPLPPPPVPQNKQNKLEAGETKNQHSGSMDALV